MEIKELAQAGPDIGEERGGQTEDSGDGQATAWRPRRVLINACVWGDHPGLREGSPGRIRGAWLSDRAQSSVCSQQTDGETA